MPDTAVHSRRPPASVPAGAARETRSRASCLGYIAVGTATLLALVAIVLPTYVAKSLVKFPDRIHQVTRATGTGDVLDFRQLLEGTVHIDHEVPVQLTTLVNSVVPTDSNLVTLCASFEVTRDGQRFLVLKNQEQGLHSLTVIVNWPALRKAQ